MHPNAILHEIQQLYSVSDRLDSLTEQHPLVSDALITISESVRNTATVLEVLVAMKMAPDPRIRSSKCLIFLEAVWELRVEGSVPKLVVENNIQE